MGDCANVNDQMIDYNGLPTLKDAQVIRAEIVSIDSNNNTAAVTLLDSCEFVDWLDLSAVSFDYLCEGNDERTAAALAYGYKAFSAFDMVFLLITQERGDIPAQAYIIGHVDIRDTKPCSRDFILIQVESKISAIFDVAAGALLDMDSFENKAGSPDKPSSPYYISGDTDWWSWFTYNFAYFSTYGKTLPTVDISLWDYITGDHCTSPNWIYNGTLYDPPSGMTTNIPYDGYGFVLKSEGDACEDFNLGNGMHHIVWEDVPFECEYGENGEYGEVIHREIKLSDASKSHFDNDDTWCTCYWPYSLFIDNYVNGGRMPDYGFKFTDNVTGETIHVEFSSVETVYKKCEAFVDGSNFNVYGENKSEQVFKIASPDIDGRSSTLTLNVDTARECHLSGANSPPFDILVPNNGLIEDVVESTGIYQYHQGMETIEHGNTGSITAMCDQESRGAGESFVLFTFGALILYNSCDDVSTLDNQAVEVTGVANDAGMTGAGYFGGTTMGGFTLPSGYRISAVPLSFLYRIPLGTDFSTPFSLAECMRNADLSASKAIDDAIVEMYRLFDEHYFKDDPDYSIEWSSDVTTRREIGFYTYKRS